MKTKRTIKAVIVTTVLLLVGGAIAYAQGGWGYGGGPGMRGYGGGKMGYGPNCENGGWGRGPCQADLSDEEAAKVNDLREKFYTDTKDLRRNIRDARDDLRDEMDKEAPETDKVLKLQKALSGLEADFDQKVIAHRMEMKKLVPEKSRGRGVGKGYGRGNGRGGGRCWR